MSEEKKSYYAIIPANVRYDKSITPNAKLLYGEITALCNEKGYCWASNNYFADLYEVTPQAVSKWINQLAKKGYITLDYERAGKEIKQRNIYIATYQQIIKEVSTKDDGGINKRLSGYQQKIKENNTVNITNNTTDNNNTQQLPSLSSKLITKETSNNNDSPFQTNTKKNKHGEYKHVLLTSDEYLRLCEEWGEPELLRMIKTLDEGIEMKGYKYKNHNLALRRWKSNEKTQRNGYSKPLPVQTRTTFLDMED
jgi:SOS-response transcriptional repressor LexA